MEKLAIKSRLTKLDKIALLVTTKIGSMGFVLACIVLAAVPLFVNSSMPVILYISSGMLQLILLPLIMVGQNLQNRHAELRAEHEYETNIKAEKEIEKVLIRLEKQHQTMLEVLKRMEKIEKKGNRFL